MDIIETEISEIKKIIAKNKNEGHMVNGPSLEALGYEDRILDEIENNIITSDQYDSIKSWSKTHEDKEIIVVDREWDRSKTFQVRADGIEAVILVKNLATNKIDEKFKERWVEKTSTLPPES